ncbi:MAG: hypothetical protein J7549_06485 [Variovorax sp.]|nr:hypothetical protein [Variovorax sp.]
MKRPSMRATMHIARCALAGLALAALAPAAPAQATRWRGDFLYFADAAVFTDCASGQRWPVAMAGDFVALQEAYMRWQGAPKTPLLANVDGHIEVREPMEGPPREHLVVERFVSVQPGTTCESLLSVGLPTAPFQR